MRQALLAVVALAAFSTVASAADIPWGTPRGTVRHPAYRPISYLGHRIVYEGGQAREVVVPYHAPSYPVVYPDYVAPRSVRSMTGGYGGGYFPYPVMSSYGSGSAYSPR